MDAVVKQLISVLLLLIYGSILHATSFSVQSLILGVAYALFKGADIFSCLAIKRCPSFHEAELCSPIHLSNSTPFLQCYIFPLMMLIPNTLLVALSIGIFTHLCKRFIHNADTDTCDHVSSKRVKICLLFPIIVIPLYNFILL